MPESRAYWRRRALEAERRLETVNGILGHVFEVLDSERRLARSSNRGMFISLIVALVALFTTLGLRAAGVAW